VCPDWYVVWPSRNLPDIFYAVAIVPAAGCTYPKLLFWHKNLENIQRKIFRKEKIHIMHSQDSNPLPIVS